MEDVVENRKRWPSVAAAALMPVVVTWFFCILVTSFIYLFTASASALNDITWADSLHFGTSFWLLSMGATLSIATVRISLIPLTLTVATWWLSLRSARRVMIATWEDSALYTGFTAAFAAVLGFIAVDGTFLIGGVIGAAFLGLTASLVAWWSAQSPQWPWWVYVSRGWTVARPILIGVAVSASSAVVIAFGVSAKRIGAIYSAYSAHWAGNIGISFIQLLYLPLFLIWALAFMAGTPIEIGQGSSFSPFHTSPVPLPGIPVLGAIPSSSTLLYFLPGILVCVGVVSAWRVVRRTATVVSSESASPVAFRERAINAAVGLAIVFLLLSGAGALATGALGSGRLFEVGVNAPMFAGLATVEIAFGFFITVALASRFQKK